MIKYYVVGECVLCGHGNLIVGKNDNSLFVFCDECDSEWKTPSDAVNAPPRSYITNNTDFPSKEEIEEKTDWKITGIKYDIGLFLAEQELNKIPRKVHYKCPVCQSYSLREQPYDIHQVASFEMCRVCGFQFGLDDFDDKESNYRKWEQAWKKMGAINLGEKALFDRMKYRQDIYDLFITYKQSP